MLGALQRELVVDDFNNVQLARSFTGLFASLRLEHIPESGLRALNPG